MSESNQSLEKEVVLNSELAAEAVESTENAEAQAEVVTNLEAEEPVEEPVAEESAEKPVPEEPVAEEPMAEEPQVEEQAEEPVAEEPAPEAVGMQKEDDDSNGTWLVSTTQGGVFTKYVFICSKCGYRKESMFSITPMTVCPECEKRKNGQA